MTDDMKVQLEWCLSDITKNYPQLTIFQARRVLELFHSGRNALIEDGWVVIDDFVYDVLKER